MILVGRGRSILSSAGEGKYRKRRVYKLLAGDYIIAIGNSAEQDL